MYTRHYQFPLLMTLVNHKHCKAWLKVFLWRRKEEKIGMDGIAVIRYTTVFRIFEGGNFITKISKYWIVLLLEIILKYYIPWYNIWIVWKIRYCPSLISIHLTIVVLVKWHLHVPNVVILAWHIVQGFYGHRVTHLLTLFVVQISRKTNLEPLSILLT